MPRPIRPNREIRVFRDGDYHHAIILAVNDIDANEVEARIGTNTKATIFLGIQTDIRPTGTRPTQWLSGDVDDNDFVPPIPEEYEALPDLELDDAIFGLLDEALVAA